MVLPRAVAPPPTSCLVSSVQTGSKVSALCHLLGQFPGEGLSPHLVGEKPHAPLGPWAGPLPGPKEGLSQTEELDGWGRPAQRQQVTPLRAQSHVWTSARVCWEAGEAQAMGRGPALTRELGPAGRRSPSSFLWGQRAGAAPRCWFQEGALSNCLRRSAGTWATRWLTATSRPNIWGAGGGPRGRQDGQSAVHRPLSPTRGPPGGYPAPHCTHERGGAPRGGGRAESDAGFHTQTEGVSQ